MNRRLNKFINNSGHWGAWRAILAIALLLTLNAFSSQSMPVTASPSAGTDTIFSSIRVGGASGFSNQKDADTNPALAFDPTTRRYLAVWNTARNAGSSSDGMDIYGVFLTRGGGPVGSEFRITDWNNAARSDPPVIAAANDQFVVAWTARGGCSIAIKRVNSSGLGRTQTLALGSGNFHSPSLAYNPNRNTFSLTFASGDDYLAPSMNGAQTSDCGNNASSTSSIKVVEFSVMNDGSVVMSLPVDVSEVALGAFRPRIAYSLPLKSFLVVWEDRRYAQTNLYAVDTYCQVLNDDLSRHGSNNALMVDGNYNNGDNTATWTSRPVVAGGITGFITGWFDQESSYLGSTWRVKSRFVPLDGYPNQPITLAEASFTDVHTDNAPTGSLALSYAPYANEYLLGITMHLESILGYSSRILVQRLDADGALLGSDGTLISDPGVGTALDNDSGDQIGVAIATNPHGGGAAADFLVAYSKHAVTSKEMDFDVWGTRIQIPAPDTPPLWEISLPMVTKLARY